jgi:hypothetical protein
VRSRSKRSTSAVRERSTARLRQRPGLEPLEQRALPSFVPLVNYPDSVFAADLAAADFNRDGHSDLTVLNSALLGGQSVGLLLGAGNGMFTAAGINSFGQALRSVAAADLNGDGNPELIVVNGQVPGVSVLLGNGNGTFKAAINTVAGPAPQAAVVGDFNGDGTFQAPFTLPTDTKGPATVVVGDFNGDHKLELATADFSSNSVSVLLGNGTFQPAVNLCRGHQPQQLAGGRLQRGR